MTNAALLDQLDGRVSGFAQADARIGPNAVIQVAAALRSLGLNGAAGAVFETAGALDWLLSPPLAMADEVRVGLLHRALRTVLPPAEAGLVLAEAGRLTADYLLAVRIPRSAQTVLSLLPTPISAWLLVRAIRANAWTFAGSGRFNGRAGQPTVFELSGNPLCAGERNDAPVCLWHAAVFQRLFHALVSADATAVETACEACGSPSCRFEISW